MFHGRLLPRTSAQVLCLLAFAWASPGHAEETPAKAETSGSFPLVEAERVEPAKEPEPEAEPQGAATPPATESLATEEKTAVLSTTKPEPPCEETSAAEGDPDAPFRAFAFMAGQERRRRYGTAMGGVVVGASSIVLGAVLQSEQNINPDIFYVLGGLGIGLALVGGVLPSQTEMQARGLRADQPGHSVEEARTLERNWEQWATAAKKRRVRGAFGGMVLGAGATGVGIAFLAGATDMSDSDRVLWGSLLLGSGVAMVAGGGLSLLVMSPMESAYQMYAASRPQSSGSAVSLKLRPFGLGLAANGTF